MAKIFTTEDLVAGGDEIRVRQMSAEICSLFEDLLGNFDIMIPDEDREGAEDEACIFGETYGNLEDAVTEKLAEFAEILRKHPGKPLNTEEY